MNRLIAVLLTLAGLVAFTLPQPAQSADELTFRLNWIPEGQPELAAYYIADEKGYFSDNNLDVTIERGSGSGDAVSLTRAGRVDLAYADLPTILTAVGDGADLVALGAVYQNSPFTTWVRSDHGIEEPKDLEGKTVGAPAGDAQRIMFPAFEQAVGLEPNSVRWVGIGPAAKVPSLASGRIDATVHFINQREIYQDAVGENLVHFYWPDYGVNPYGNAIFTSRDTLDNRTDEIDRFVDAAFRAYQWLIANPDESLEILRERVPEAEIESVRPMLEQEIPLMDSEHVREHGLGWMDAERMQETVDLVEEHFDLEESIDPDEVYTNEFLPGYGWPEE